MKQWIFSQNLYPQKLVIDKDTVVVITPYQLSITNKIFVERDFLKIENVELSSTIQLQDTLIESIGRQVEKWKKLNQANESIIEGMKQREIENLKKQKKLTWKVGGICFGIGTITGIAIMFLNNR